MHTTYIILHQILHMKCAKPATFLNTFSLRTHLQFSLQRGKSKRNQSVNFTSLTVNYLFDFPIMAAVFCFTSVCLSWPYSEPQFCSTAEQRGSTFSALSDLHNLSPKARWGTHTAEIIITGHYNILCQDPVVPGNAHIFLRCLGLQSLHLTHSCCPVTFLSYIRIGYWGHSFFHPICMLVWIFLMGK